MSQSYSDDTVDLPEEERGSASGSEGGKVCCSCGKSVEGHRRFKDSAGYWCKDCHRVDRKRQQAPEGRCPDCGRMRPIDKLITAEDGAAVCSACMKERVKKAERFAVKAANDAAEVAEERRTIYIYGGVVAVIVVIVLVSLVFRIMRS
jgi:NMD protein affecting ribosome stability and mRNA decay